MTSKLLVDDLARDRPAVAACGASGGGARSSRRPAWRDPGKIAADSLRALARRSAAVYA
jgi:hypothetical protein